MTNTATLNSRLAAILAPQADAPRPPNFACPLRLGFAVQSAAG